MSFAKTHGGKWAGDASTNIFYFASMRKLKWRVFESTNISIAVEPTHPIITTCSMLFHASKLVTWHLGRNGLQLWIFYWPTDEVDLSSMELLKEVQQGVWDHGLPSECLSHLYKAVHQHFERSFFNVGYARVGKYFVKADGTAQQSFQIGFFIHGDDHLCASIELKEKMQVHFLKKSNLDNSQKLKVVLMPIGIECSLTGTYLSPMSAPETLRELEELFPAYRIDRNNPVNCHTLFLVEIAISGYTMLYPASHVLIVNHVLADKKVTSTLCSMNDEVAGLVSSEGEVTSASTTHDVRDTNQQAMWKESGFWTYKPPPDNVKCSKHSTSTHSAVVESCTSITKRVLQPVHKKRLQRSVYKSNLARNKYRDDKSPVINLPTLPINTDKVSTTNTPAPSTETTGPLPRLQPTIELLLPQQPVAEPFDPQPLTIECVENTACRDESSLFPPGLIPGLALSNKLYRIPSTTARRPLPTSVHLTPPPPPIPAPIRRVVSETTSVLAKRVNPHTSSSPLKKVKQELVQEGVEMSPATAQKPDLQSEYKSERQKVFTHEIDIAVNEADLDKLFESDPSDTDEDYGANNPLSSLVLDDNIPVVPESCLTPDNLTDPKCTVSPMQCGPPTQFINPQSHDYPTPPSNDTNSYESGEEVMQSDVKHYHCEKRCDTYYQLLLDSSPYASLTLTKTLQPVPTYIPVSTSQPPHKHIMINSPRKTSEQTPRYQDMDITSELDKISSELKDLGALSNSPDYSRTLQMSIIKDEITLQSIGDKIMQSPDQTFVFPNTFSQANIKKELSDLPKLQGGQFLIKFGDSHINKFVVSPEDVHIPGGYSCIANESRSVMLDVSRMEIYATNDHKCTVGYLPKTSIAVSLYQSLESRTLKLHNATAFAAVENSRFTPSFLKILQQLVRDVKEERAQSSEDVIQLAACVITVGKLLEEGLPISLVVQKPRTCLLPWNSFSALTANHDGGTEQPIPSVVLGNDTSWISMSPTGLPHWLSKGMEPYSGRKNVSYLVVTPDNPHIINNINIFFKELSTVYEMCHLGHHRLLATKIRDGVMRVGKKSGEKTYTNTCDSWFVSNDDPESLTWQTYAKCCHHLLAKYLTKFESQAESEFRSIVIYFIDPFTTKCHLTKTQLIMRCFNAMQIELDKIKNTQFIMQCIPVDYVSDLHKNLVTIGPSLRSICFSVYNQALKHTKPKPLATCLTGFGPISDEAVVLEGGEQHKPPITLNYHVHTPTMVLNTKPFKEVSLKHDTLYCAYSLSHDNNWVIVSLTDSSGHMVDTAVYAVDEPIRQGGVPASVLSKIWCFCLSVIETYKCLWSVVISKMGNITDSEDHVWSENFKTAATWNTQLQERCKECVLSNKVHSYGVASTSLLSVLNISHINILPLLNRPKSLDIRTSAHIISLSQQQPIVEYTDRYKKLQEDSFTFYSGPETRERIRRVLASAYLATSAEVTNIPRHMGPGKSSVLLGNIHQHVVFVSTKKHVLCSDNHTLVLRHILQRHDALSWLQVTTNTSKRHSPLPLHMLTIANIYRALERVTFVPP